MAITYLSSPNRDDLAGSTYLGKSTAPLGYISRGPAAGTRVGDRVRGIDLSLGSYDQHSHSLFLSDRAPNKPSGYDTEGNPTYGQGEQNVNTTFNADYSFASPRAKFTYARPSRPSGVEFGALQ